MNTKAYFTRDEVVIHNTQADIWVIVNCLVFDLTKLFEGRVETMNDNLRLLLQFGGKDLSSYFNDHGEPLERINQYGNKVPVFPPAFEKESSDSEFWWCDKSIILGKITCLQRRVRVINTLTKKIVSMNVCEEDSIATIKRKYSTKFNSNAEKYVWRKTNTRAKTSGHLFMQNSLSQNGILFQKNEKLGLPPALWLFYVLNKD